jgi:hypothetical protein
VIRVPDPPRDEGHVVWGFKSHRKWWGNIFITELVKYMQECLDGWVNRYIDGWVTGWVDR